MAAGRGAGVRNKVRGPADRKTTAAPAGGERFAERTMVHARFGASFAAKPMVSPATPRLVRIDAVLTPSLPSAVTTPIERITALLTV
jgi:hypothetical protein